MIRSALAAVNDGKDIRQFTDLKSSGYDEVHLKNHQLSEYSSKIPNLKAEN